MKKIQMLFLALVLGSVTVLVSSCGKDDPCKNVDCGTNGDCFEGSCVCNLGYELGTDNKCSEETRSKLIASYSFVDVCSTGTYTGTASITKSSAGVTSIVITNFGGTGNSATAVATVDKSNKITIPNGTLGTFTVSNASGTYASGKITWSYNLKDSSGGTDVCTSTWTKL